jgi:TatD-related deoxyribonuclease
VPLPTDLPVVDHHCHLSPAGEGVLAARRFRRAGGTHLFLATQNYGPGVPLSLADYERQFARTETLAQQVRSETGVVVYLVVAPYPVDLLTAAPVLGVATALDLQRTALELAGRWVRERRAIALGEVGRPHFAVPPEIDAAATESFDHALRVAHDVDCPVVVHSADLDAAGYREIAERAERAGVAPERVVKHYARGRLPPSERSSVTPSYLARRELVRDVLSDPGPWFIETDFLDDPARPGAVLDLATVPRRAATLSERSEDRDRLWGPFVESVQRVYRIRPEALAAGVP